MVVRGDGGAILPTTGYQLEAGDQLRIAGSREAAHRIELVNNINVLLYVRTGCEAGSGWIWRQMRAGGAVVDPVPLPPLTLNQP